MSDYADGLPPTLTAGDTWRWYSDVLSREHPPADGWSVQWHLVGATETHTFAASDDGGRWLVEVPAATTANIAPGLYEARAVATNGVERITWYGGRVEVAPDPTTATATDPRSHAEKVLEAIRAVIEGRATKDQESYSINGRSLSRTPLSDLLELEREYARRVARERRARDREAGRLRGNPRLIHITFRAG